MKRPTPSLQEYLDRRFSGKPRRRLLLCAAIIAVMAVLQCLQLDMSCVTLRSILNRKIVYPFFNCGLILLVDVLLFLLTMRWHVAFHIGNVLFCLYGVANYYTLMYRAEPITLGLLSSLSTALDVIGGYRFPLAGPVIFSLAVLLVNTLLACLLQRAYPGRQRFTLRRFCLGLAGLALLAGCAVGGFAALDRFDPLSGWFPFGPHTREQGYPVYVVRQALIMRKTVHMPEGYSDEAIDRIADSITPPSLTMPDPAPDLIFIMNESFYDLNDYMDMQTDVPLLPNWYSTENAIRGRVVVPGVGGGTNNSEYELFTSNSMYLLPASAPFNYLPLSDVNSTVWQLRALGYDTWGMHPAAASNYYRSHGYPAMGFAHCCFSTEFANREYWGERAMTDASNYRELCSWYESAGSGPRMMYLLTYQNHGGYEQNDSAWDTIHTGLDLGDMTDDVDEYLTSVQMSDAALAELLAYFDGVDRPVLVCMMGDHAPNFIRQLPAREGLSQQQSDLLLSSTPIMIWANAAFGPLETRDDLLLSVPDVMPVVLQLAGLPLTPYCQTVLALSEQLPFRMSSGRYYTADGQSGSFTPGDSRFDLLSRYYYMEYNNLQDRAERRQVLFTLDGQ